MPFSPEEIRESLRRKLDDPDTRHTIAEFLDFRRSLRNIDGGQPVSRQVLLGAMALLIEEIGSNNSLHHQEVQQAFVCQAISEILVKALGTYGIEGRVEDRTAADAKIDEALHWALS